jgi:hypothetical protein
MINAAPCIYLLINTAIFWFSCGYAFVYVSPAFGSLMNIHAFTVYRVFIIMCKSGAR